MKNKIEDLTVVMLTPNKVPEKWAEFHKKMLLETIGNTPLITISNKPLDWGTNLIQEDYGVTNIYRQMLRGFKLATTTYVAMADDDTLYSKEHFEHKPPLNKFAYNYNRWHLFSWGKPFYFYKPRPGGGCMIAPRDLAINMLEARFARQPEEFIGYMARELGTSKYDEADFIDFYTYIPIVSFYHENSCDPINQKRKKVPWPVQAFDLPKWRKAKDLRKEFV